MIWQAETPATAVNGFVRVNRASYVDRIRDSGMSAK
jgi:hypothetical protein